MKLSSLHIFLFILVSFGLISCFVTLEGFHDDVTNRRMRRRRRKGNCNKIKKNDIMGITKNMIPKGDEHLYILKSQIVPPVCPVCPSIETSCPPQKEVTPCPPCARCPEPSFECKKVPNYASALKNNVMPRAVLSDFSSFGM